MWIILAIVLVLAIAVLVVSYPLFFHPLEPYELDEESEQTFSERDALLDALSDLEQEHAAGKVSPGDYQAQKAGLERRYIELAEAEE